MKTSLLLAGAGLLLSASLAEAQVSASTSTSPTMRHLFGLHAGGAYMSPGYGSYPYGYWASTAQEGIGNGIGRVIESRAQANLNRSQAALNWSEAQRRQMENWKKAVETSLETQRINRDAREAQRGPKPTSADYLRMAQVAKPRHLTPSQRNLLTGELTWPIALQADEYAPYRETLERFSAHQADRAVPSLEEYQKVEQDAQSLLAMLRQNIGEFSVADYMAGRRFLESFAYEARLAAANNPEAMQTASIAKSGY